MFLIFKVQLISRREAVVLLYSPCTASNLFSAQQEKNRLPVEVVLSRVRLKPKPKPSPGLKPDPVRTRSRAREGPGLSIRRRKAARPLIRPSPYPTEVWKSPLTTNATLLSRDVRWSGTFDCNIPLEVFGGGAVSGTIICVPW
jgi:hypothetical protein